MTRPETIIPEKPVAPYPITNTSSVISGFGRGSSELGIPTANVEKTSEIDSLEPGIYYGWSKVIPQDKQTEIVSSHNKEIEFNYGKSLTKTTDLSILPMVVSIGYNPFYDNKEKSVEIHIINEFNKNFYGAKIRYTILGYIRPELNYTTKEALIDDINLDIKIAKDILEKPEFEKFKSEVESS